MYTGCGLGLGELWPWLGLGELCLKTGLLYGMLQCSYNWFEIMLLRIAITLTLRSLVIEQVAQLDYSGVFSISESHSQYSAAVHAKSKTAALTLFYPIMFTLLNAHFA